MDSKSWLKLCSHWNLESIEIDLRNSKNNNKSTNFGWFITNQAVTQHWVEKTLRNFQNWQEYNTEDELSWVSLVVRFKSFNSRFFGFSAEKNYYFYKMYHTFSNLSLKFCELCSTQCWVTDWCVMNPSKFVLLLLIFDNFDD